MKQVTQLLRSEKSLRRLSGSMQFAVSLICLSMLIYTAKDKITDHQRFLDGISKVSFFSNWSKLISWLVPGTEILTALLLLFPKTNRVGLWCFILVMSVFSVYILAALIWLDKLPCHCGGIIETLTWREHLAFNLGFIGLAAWALWLGKKD
ncbi:MauE/DoxX family redox-associated membrane protein [Pedobacter sp.]|uniref:MauE/DoxX family redox-associated membrane protein n=1 Tax=Pedobacter sp. TaxID=1411316 RepID=UPI003C67D5EE